MPMPWILILEDNERRIEGFRAAVAAMPTRCSLQIWNDAPSMLQELDAWLGSAHLMSLDHDLAPRADRPVENPGCGMDVVAHLVKRPPACPVLVHTGNETKRFKMHRELQYAGWTSEPIAPDGVDWIEVRWKPRVQSFLKSWQSKSP